MQLNVDARAYETLLVTEPYFAAIQWVDVKKKKIMFGPIEPPVDPKQKFLLTLDLDTKFFERYAKFNFAKLDGCTSKTWWEDGMQRYVVNTAHAVSDDLEDGVFLLYSAMNDSNCPMFLGKLKPGDEFTVAVANRLRALIAL